MGCDKQQSERERFRASRALQRGNGPGHLDNVD